MYLCCALRGCRKNFALCFWDFLENHNPFFLGQTALTIFLVITALSVWSHLCESCYGSLRPFFNKMSKQYGFATGRLV